MKKVVYFMERELVEVIRNMLKEELQPIKVDVNRMKEDINGMKEDIRLIKVRQNEHGELMRILVDKAEVNKAEHDAVRHDMAKVLETVNSVRKDLAAVEIVTARNMENIAYLKAIK